MNEFTLAVGDLARFCHRSGDIDHRFTPSPSGAEGIAGHQRLYRQRPDSYQREYAVEYRRSVAGTPLLLRGRADGFDPVAGLVEEIKTCRVTPDSIPLPVQDLHLAQGRIYAAIIAQAEDLPGLQVRVTWFNIDNNEEHSRTESYNREQLSAFLHDSLDRFAGWLELVAELRGARDGSLRELAFPHGEFRAGQRDIAELVYKCIDQRGQLLLEAPTGIGKTAAVLYPALKALATDKHDKLVFLTARTVGRLAAEATLQHFATTGYCGSSLSLTAKEAICLSPGSACHGDDCPYARGYYDKLPGAMPEALGRGALTRQDMEDLGRSFELCPYELARDLLPWVDVIIGDIHYMYSLGSLLGSATDAAGERWSVLVDEAHNLPDRARGMYSAQLAKARLLAVKRGVGGAVNKALAAANRQFLALDKGDWQEPQYHSSPEPPVDLLNSLQGVIGAISDELAREPAFLQRQPELADFYFDVLQFTRVADEWGDEFRCRLSRNGGKQRLRVGLNCLDPARLLAQRHEHGHSITAFSATLSPLPWSRDALGLEPGAVVHRALSPFAGEQLRVSLASRISTRYRDRESSMPGLVERLARWLREVPGNCIVYFPSYTYMQSALADLGEPPGRTLWVQQAEMDEASRRDLLNRLASARDMAAFCILGGIFGEGIDLPGEQLKSVVIVGMGMPQVNRNTRELQAFYQQRYGQGFEYAFIYPGMQKVDQALGRVVRTLEDTGSALLIDTRYGEPPYRDLLPPWWSYRED